MPVLFTQHWDILHGKEKEYADFVVDQYIPRAAELGLHIVGGYYVAVGQGPRVISVASTESLDDMEKILRTKGIRALTQELRNYVYEYDNEIMAPTGRVKNKKHYTIQPGVWKFNQYWDLLPGKILGYSNFIAEEYLPGIEGLNLVEVTGGWNVILGSGPKIVAEFSAKDPSTIGELFEKEEFRRLTRKLRTQYVVHFSSRMLCPTERFGGPELTSLEKKF